MRLQRETRQTWFELRVGGFVIPGNLARVALLSGGEGGTTATTAKASEGK